MFPLADASRRPSSPPLVTIDIIIANVLVFFLEVIFGDAFITRYLTRPHGCRDTRPEYQKRYL